MTRAHTGAVLDLAARAHALAATPGWRECDQSKAITRRFAFADFAQAWTFMTRIALEAQAMHHHPDWRNIYGEVAITLTTHDAGGLTQRDFTLARLINTVAATSGARTEEVGDTHG